MNPRDGRSFYVFGICGFLSAGAFALAVVGRHDVTDEKLVELGARFPAVGQVLPDGVGTLIAPRWVITTAHAATLIPKGEGVFRLEGKEYKVAKVFMHPHSTISLDEPPEIDMALLILGEEVKSVTPLAFYKEKDEEGQSVTIVGFGEGGDGKSKTRRRADEKRRAVTNVVSEVNSMRLLCKFDEPPAGKELEGVAALGDGGAPALVKVEEAWLVAGVSSPHQEGPSRLYGGMNGFTRVSTFVPWIEKTMKDNQ